MPAVLSPEQLLNAYAQGVFPMGDDQGRLAWYTADPRGIIPLDDRFHIPRSLTPLLNRPSITLQINFDFPAVMRACMQPRAKDARLGRTRGSWITPELIAAYTQLHELGFAHSVEIWQDGVLAGGLYGVTLGAAFFGESMFHVRRDASKIALVRLVQRLRDRQFMLLDSQATTPHLRKFGCYDVPAHAYRKMLDRAIAVERSFA